MRIFVISVAAALTIWSLIAGAVESNRLVVVNVVFARDAAVCRAVAAKVGAATPEEFRNGTWRDRFTSANWMSDTFPTITAEGRALDLPFRYTFVDIHNDGTRDAVVVYSGMMASTEFDWLYVFTSKQFRAAQAQKRVGIVMNEVPVLNPANWVQFSNGQTGNPVELEIWKHKGRNYLLLKEPSFAHADREAPHSLLVAKLSRTSRKWQRVGKLNVQRLLPDLICQLRAK